MPRERAFAAVEVASVLSVRGGAKKGWSAVPTVEVNGKTTFGVSNKETWILDHAFGNHVMEKKHTEALQ
eukprot:14514751-Alexandrium_andersonii.AAC.1